uniref:Uncharacterized protein n=1 Tax=Ascaris lumbricoides TaxID=6252 RepID=A0A0M3HJ43_ASCLU
MNSFLVDSYNLPNDCIISLRSMKILFITNSKMCNAQCVNLRFPAINGLDRIYDGK